MEKINEFAERMKALSEQEQEYVKLIMEEWLDNLQEAIGIIESGDYIVWHDCNNMSDVAKRQAKELFGIPNSVRDFIDFEKWGRYLENNSRFLEGAGYYLQILY